MAESTDSRPTVVVVDDEPDVADVLALTLQQEYDVRTAYGGETALESVDDEVDAVLLDRNMPDLHGDEVLERLRDRGYDGVVIMTTAVDPDLNILEMDFDDYLCKPVHGDTLRETLEHHLEDDRADDRLDEYFRVVSKLSVLEAEYGPEALAGSAEYERLERRATELSAELDGQVEDFDALVDTFQDISRDAGGDASSP